MSRNIRRVEYSRTMHPAYTLIRSKRRSLSIQIDASGNLIARAPMRMLLGSIEGFIMTKINWITKHQIKRIATPQRPILSESEINMAKKKLREYIVPRVAELWEWKWLPQVTSIKITKSERRWGSCSAVNWLCFSYRLAEWLKISPIVGFESAFLVASYSEAEARWGIQEVPPPIPPIKGRDFIDAIIIHELAHLREKHHQKSFWDLVYSMMPEYESVMQNQGNIE